VNLDHFLQLGSWQQHECYEAPGVCVCVCVYVCVCVCVLHSADCKQLRAVRLLNSSKALTEFYIALHSMHEYYSIRQTQC
jgi:hypothetical protein